MSPDLCGANALSTASFKGTTDVVEGGTSQKCSISPLCPSYDSKDTNNFESTDTNSKWGKIRT